MDAKVAPHPFLYSDWVLSETQFDPHHQHHKETVFTVGNGYLGTRGSFEEGYPGAWAATFINGVYDDVPVVYTELANCPDWLALSIAIEGERFRLDRGEILSYSRQLDLKRGLLDRRVRWRSPGGHTLDLSFERFASLDDRHVLALMVGVTPVDFQGEIEIQSSINGYPENQGIVHWEWVNQGAIGNRDRQLEGVWLHVQTRNSRIQLGMASRIDLRGANDPDIQLKGCEGYPTIAATFSASPGQTVSLAKVLTVFTTRETPDPAAKAIAHLSERGDYTELRSRHEKAWDATWDKWDITIEGDLKAQLAVRYNLFQLAIATPRDDDRVSIPAKTLSGFGYKGHIFWDTEIFIVPALTFTQPELARNLLTYRYHTLPGSRRKAKASGYPGALIAWESADTGDEVTPRWVLSTDPETEPIRIWCGDRELHITTDVVYAIWQYWQGTGDDEWMSRYGAEIILDTALFWGSRVEWDGKRERYEIRNVIGPDEYHERVDNNAFTNRMVQWHLQTALAILQWLAQYDGDRCATLTTQLDLTEERQQRWADIVRGLWIPYDPATGTIEQCENFFQLEDIDLEAYEPRTRSMQAILGIEGANKRQVLKQPDVLMLLYVLRGSGPAIASPGNHLLYYDRDVLRTNWDYYAPRTDRTYGSSLGPAIHAILACDLDKPEEAYRDFMLAAMVDLEDVRGNAADGIHAASAGGVWQAVVFGFGGVQLPGIVPGDEPIATPHFPPGWTRLKFKLQWRGKTYEFDLNPCDSTNDDRHGCENSTIRGVIFDLDGVLTDTAEFHYRSWQKLADEEGIPFNREMNEAMRGLSRRDSLLQMLGDRPLSEAEMERMMARKNEYYVEFTHTMGPEDLLPGVVPLLEQLRSRQIAIAIGSASKNAQLVVERLGIAPLVDAIADGHSVEQSKPAPDLFLHAASLIGVAPAECLVVEDAASGVEAALAAGMYAVGLGPTNRVGNAHAVLPNLDGVRWEDLLGKLGLKSQ
ncbi:beta-phosphoglucomutase [Oxynema aestuarii]|uniref:Beta-phosphoglucomutase n=1 Tax=Oxynema aestuarii AP17 TaxID=2064643 RepID=A0A6H1TZI3_9CYAN|nr:beta-phosphoglucomutase [Oxynema aestuarii]QIZ71183.1 beta-phosphoglucomutase [Oxynema aestuarii AP17]RMH76976.1 MAG: beta-phosphoglucomutase [Cyanobacteria bacterium J007]